MTWITHLFTQRTVVIDVQHVDVHSNRSLRLPIGGRDFECVSVFGLSVQSFLHDQTPLALVRLDDGELAQRVPVCRWDGEQNSWLLDQQFSCHFKNVFTEINDILAGP